MTGLAAKECLSGDAYELLAELLEYPRRSPAEVAATCAGIVRERAPSAAAALDDVVSISRTLDSHECEELYAATFDLDPARSLDIGFQIFGETYKRGVFLVKMQRAVQTNGIARGCELADHLPVLLRLLARLDDDAPAGEDARSLAEDVILPGVAKVLTTFDGARRDHPYRRALEALVALLQLDFHIDHVELPRDLSTSNSPFLGDGRRGRALPILQENLP